MAPTSLLRYVFRHGRHGRSGTAEVTSDHESRKPMHTSHSPEKQDHRPKSPTASAESEEPMPSLVHQPRSESRASTVLEDIAEESGSDDDWSMAESLAALDIGIENFTTRELLTATLKEAKSSLHAHLDTIDIALEVLRALDGFSATIVAVKEEMEATKEMCEEKLKVIRDVERFVDCLQFPNE